MSIKENLVQLMSNNNVTVKELSLITDISEPTIKRLRTRDDSNPTLEVLQKLSKALNSDLDTLTRDNPLHIFFQGEKINFSMHPRFIYKILDDIFEFKAGNQLEFKEYEPGVRITKYIISDLYLLLQTIDANTLKFRDQNGVIAEFKPTNIKATITKLVEIKYD